MKIIHVLKMVVILNFTGIYMLPLVAVVERPAAAQGTVAKQPVSAAQAIATRADVNQVLERADVVLDLTKNEYNQMINKKREGLLNQKELEDFNILSIERKLLRSNLDTLKALQARNIDIAFTPGESSMIQDTKTAVGEHIKKFSDDAQRKIENELQQRFQAPRVQSINILTDSNRYLTRARQVQQEMIRQESALNALLGQKINTVFVKGDPIEIDETRQDILDRMIGLASRLKDIQDFLALRDQALEQTKTLRGTYAKEAQEDLQGIEQTLTALANEVDELLSEAVQFRKTFDDIKMAATKATPGIETTKKITSGQEKALNDFVKISTFTKVSKSRANKKLLELNWLADQMIGIAKQRGKDIFKEEFKNKSTQMDGLSTALTKPTKVDANIQQLQTYLKAKFNSAVGSIPVDAPASVKEKAYIQDLRKLDEEYKKIYNAIAELSRVLKQENPLPPSFESIY